MNYKKMLKKLQKFIRKQWNIDYIDIRLDDKIVNVAERVIMKSERCNLEEAYKKWIIKPEFHLPGWTSFIIVSEFTTSSDINQNSTIKDLFDAI